MLSPEFDESQNRLAICPHDPMGPLAPVVEAGNPIGFVPAKPLVAVRAADAELAAYF
jgi:hypothetical protein